MTEKQPQSWAPIPYNSEIAYRCQRHGVQVNGLLCVTCGQQCIFPMQLKSVATIKTNE